MLNLLATLPLMSKKKKLIKEDFMRQKLRNSNANTSDSVLGIDRKSSNKL